MRILAGIVTYNPDPERLRENIRAVAPQVDRLLLVDNGSDHTEEIRNLAHRFHATVIWHKKNKGIARALLEIMDFATHQGYDWVLTLDQDSVCMPALISTYKAYLGMEYLGALTCMREDRNYSVSYADIGALPEKEHERELKSRSCTDHPSDQPIDQWDGQEDSLPAYSEVERCITSGCLMSVEAYRHTDGYDSRLFIDWVDFDISYALRDAGYHIIQINQYLLRHELGRSYVKNKFGRTLLVTNHPAWRQYYISRNTVIVCRRHPKSVSFKDKFILEIKRIIVTCIYEKGKFTKLASSLKGLAAGFLVPVNTLRAVTEGDKT